MTLISAVPEHRSKPLKIFAEFAPAGAKAVYWRGTYLANYTLAEFARKLQTTGLCELVQRRVTQGRKTEFEYIAIKRRAA